MKYCPNCREEFQDWVQVCIDCGTALVEELPPLSPPSKGEELPKIGILGCFNAIVYGIVTMNLFLIAGYAVQNRNDPVGLAILALGLMSGGFVVGFARANLILGVLTVFLGILAFGIVMAMSTGASGQEDVPTVLGFRTEDASGAAAWFLWVGWFIYIPLALIGWFAGRKLREFLVRRSSSQRNQE